MPQRESESSTIRSNSDQENSTPSTSHYTLRDDECVETMHSAISSGDFGQVAQLKSRRKLTDHEKLTILSTHFVPPRNYMFPTLSVGGRDCCFQHGWLEKHNGLVYSELQDGGYCKYCVLIAREGPKLKLGALINRPLIEFKRATVITFSAKKKKKVSQVVLGNSSIVHSNYE